LSNDDQTGRLTEEDVNHAYQKILLRSADPSGLKCYAGLNISLHELELKLKGSQEYRDRNAARNRKKVLLFGAYGNGNLGDAIQARSLLNCISSCCPEIEIWATTVFPGTYSFPSERTLPAGTIRNLKALSQFDALLIGGGGLLAHPHEPLPDASWVKSIPIPFAFLSIGANEQHASQAQVAISAAAWAGGRDFETIRELRKYRSQVDFMPDPVLLEDEPSIPASKPITHETCWVLRGPLDENHEFIASILKSEDVVVGMEPENDGQLKSIFPNMIFAHDIESFNSILASSRRVVSMRFHGVILALRLQRPVYSIRLPKGTALLQMLGLSDFAHARAKDLMFLNTRSSHSCEPQRRFLRKLFDNNLRNMLVALNMMPAS
jgi:hypothetical protein